MTRNFRARPVGWRGESHRHYLASKGVSTRRYSADRGFDMTMLRTEPGGDGNYFEDKGVSDFERLHREGVRRERIPDYESQVKLADEEREILDMLQADDELASPAMKRALQARYDDSVGRELDPRWAKGSALVERRSRRYNYVPTYAVGDMSLIAADGVGTAGAAVIPMIPIIVPALLAYGGAKYIANKKKKTGSYFDIKQSYGQGVVGYKDTESGKFFYDLESAEKFVADRKAKHLLHDQKRLAAREVEILDGKFNSRPKTTDMVINVGGDVDDSDRLARNAELASQVRALNKSRVPVKRVKGFKKVKKKRVEVEDDPVNVSDDDRLRDFAVWRSGRPSFKRYDKLDDLSEKDYAYDLDTELKSLKKDESKLPLGKRGS